MSSSTKKYVKLIIFSALLDNRSIPVINYKVELLANYDECKIQRE